MSVLRLDSADHPQSPSGSPGGHAATAYRADIDGLRAVSIIGVMLAHAGLAFTGGYVGVDIFFVISGFLITGLIHRQAAAGTFSLATFWARRIRRIVPALFAVCIATAVASWFILLPDSHAQFGEALVRVVAMISNLHFNRDAGYFSPDSERIPLLHTWSLAVEEQFYLVVPLLALLAMGVRGRARRCLPIAIAAMIAASLIASIVETRRHPDAAFYLIWSRAWELLAGALLALAPAVAARTRAWWLEAAALAGVALILAAFVGFDDDNRFPGEAALLPVVGAVLIIWSGGASGQATVISRCLAGRIPVGIGLISYSLYLWHWPLLALARSVSPAALDLATRATLVAAAFPLAWLTWRFVEQPFRSRRLLPGRAGFIATVFGCAVALVAWGTVLRWKDGFPSRLPDSALTFVADAAVDRRWVRNTRPTDLPDRVMRIGDPADPADVLIWGDSHAMAILPAIDALCAERHRGAYAIAHSSTPPLLDFVQTSKHGLGERAPAFGRAVVEIVAARRIRSVVLVAKWEPYAAYQEFMPCVEATVRALGEAGARAYFLRDVPCFAADVPRTLALYAWRDRRPELTMGLDEYRRDSAYLSDLAPLFAAHRVVVLDPGPHLPNTPDAILPYDDSGSWYRDSQHLSTRGALGLKPLFESLFAP